MAVFAFNQPPIAVIGLGYVGLPLTVEFGKTRPVIGYDIDTDRVHQLTRGQDTTRSIDRCDLQLAQHARFTDSFSDLAEATTFIIAVPTPINGNNRPDLGPLLSATRTVGQVLKPGDIVIYESTVYPGATEEDCVPVLEAVSGLVFNKDFFCGYSPERINPGDPDRTLPKIVKVVAGSTPETTDTIEQLYASIVTAGIYRAESIRVAEAAKVIENTQRDVNIALINEFSMVFNRLCLDTDSVLEAAGSKWNFLPFRPGLVGGHCIGVDPYYLTHKAEEVGHNPQIILAGRRINDDMGAYAANRLIKAMMCRKIEMNDARVLVLGLTFKENCPDIRTTKVVDLIKEISSFGLSVDVHDPLACPKAAKAEFGLNLLKRPITASYDAIVLAVAHHEFCECGSRVLRKFGKANHLFFDLKSVFSISESDLRL